MNVVNHRAMQILKGVYLSKYVNKMPIFTGLTQVCQAHTRTHLCACLKAHFFCCFLFFRRRPPLLLALFLHFPLLLPLCLFLFRLLLLCAHFFRCLLLPQHPGSHRAHFPLLESGPAVSPLSSPAGSAASCKSSGRSTAASETSDVTLASANRSSSSSRCCASSCSYSSFGMTMSPSILSAGENKCLEAI